jgi:hypothetical protein
MTRLRQALDAARAARVSLAPAPPRQRLPVVAVPDKRSLSVVKALEWAFAVEQVSLEFDEVNPDSYAVGCDPIYRMMRQAELGCRVDGGGVSARADDAEVIASIVARLPMSYGGKGMAVQVAYHARACSAPDPMVGAVPKVVPRDGWRLTKHGEFARTEVVGSVTTIYRGRKSVHDLIACPVMLRPSQADIGRARRAYLDWWGALLHLRYELAACGLETIEVTQDMPPLEPWVQVS